MGDTASDTGSSLASSPGTMVEVPLLSFFVVFVGPKLLQIIDLPMSNCTGGPHRCCGSSSPQRTSNGAWHGRGVRASRRPRRETRLPESASTVGLKTDGVLSRPVFFWYSWDNFSYSKESRYLVLFWQLKIPACFVSLQPTTGMASMGTMELRIASPI